ncbi:MAG: hypothetical protein ACKVU2_11170, partial [Saprospiraceae bacterium]
MISLTKTGAEAMPVHTSEAVGGGVIGNTSHTSVVSKKPVMTGGMVSNTVMICWVVVLLPQSS